MRYRVPVNVVAAALIFLLAPANAMANACTGLISAMTRAPAGAVLLASFPTAPPGPLKDTAFLYDNAAAAIALIGCGHRKEAERIGDAILYAQANDRHFKDGRLRNGYLAGAMNKGPAKLSGWWDKEKNAWLEDGYQAGSDSGNMAWAMLALSALDRPGDARHLAGGERIARFLTRFHDLKSPGGFRGGTFGHEPAPKTIGWKSTEHNADIAAALMILSNATKNPRWSAGAKDATQFVDRMWMEACPCFATGTREDGITPNPFLALDAQAWPLLALPGAAKSYAVEDIVWDRLRVRGGFTYAEGGTSLWTEGTAQMAVLFALLGRDKDAETLRAAIERQRAAGGFYFATDAETLPTGFMLDTDPLKPRLYYRLPHLGATAWAALAEQRFNPFTATRALP